MLGDLVILSDLEDFTNARAAYKRAITLNSSLAVARLDYAIFEYRRGNVAAAAEMLKTTETSGRRVNYSLYHYRWLVYHSFVLTNFRRSTTSSPG